MWICENVTGYAIHFAFYLLNGTVVFVAVHTIYVERNIIIHMVLVMEYTKQPTSTPLL